MPFYAAAFFVNLPLELAPQVGCGAIIYFMTNLRAGVSHFITFVIIMALENFTGIALGMVLSAWLKSVDVVPKVAPLFVVLFLMLALSSGVHLVMLQQQVRRPNILVHWQLRIQPWICRLIYFRCAVRF